MTTTTWLTTMKPTFTNEWLALPPKESHHILEKIKLLEQDPTPDAKVKKQLKHLGGKLHRHAPAITASSTPSSNLQELNDVGKHYDHHRQSIMLARQEGLTKTYNRFHNPHETAEDIVHLRQLHREMDKLEQVFFERAISFV